MKHFLIFFVVLISFRAFSQNNEQNQKDSLRNVIATSEGEVKRRAYLQLSNFYYVPAASNDLMLDTLLSIYRDWDAESLKMEAYNGQGLIRANTLAVYLNRNEFDKIFKLAPEYLDYLAKREVWRHYFTVYRIYLNAYIRNSEYEKAIEGAKKMYQEAKQRENYEGQGIALNVMSEVFRKMNRIEETVKYLKESIDILKKDNALISIVAGSYFRLCDALYFLERYDEMLKEAQEYEKIIYQFEEVSKTKQNGEWMNLWRIYLKYFMKNEEYNQVELYCNKLDSLNGGPLIRQHVFDARAHIFYHRKQYDKALEMVDKSIELANRDLNLKSGAMSLKLMILCSKKGIDDIHLLFKETAELTDSVRNVEISAKLDELRTQYEVDKITAEKERANIEKVRNRNYFLLSAGGCVFLSIALGIWIFYSRTVIRKNRRLVLQIKEQDRLEAELEAVLAKNSDENLPLQNAALEEKEENFGIFFRRLTLLMKEKRLFTDFEVNRKDIASQIGISDRGLHDCIKKGANMSFMEYINSLRLTYSRELLSVQDERFTIDAIASKAGFKSRSTFYRLFNEKYGLSPKQFIQAVR